MPGDDAQIVGDQQERRAGLGQRRPERVEHLGLHGHVERRGRLVRQDHLGVVRHPDGDDGPLAHAAGELVRVVVDALRGVRDADLGQQLDGARFGRPPCEMSWWARIASVICQPMV